MTALILVSLLQWVPEGLSSSWIGIASLTNFPTPFTILIQRSGLVFE